MTQENQQAALDYARGGFGHELVRGSRPLVLVIDLQLGFTDPTSPVGANLDSVIDSTATVLEAARSNNIPVVFSTIAYKPDFSDIGLWSVKVPSSRALVAGSRWVEIDPRLGLRPSERVMVKQSASACFGTSLLADLRDQGVNTVIVAGTSTSGCVRATVVDLFQGGFPTLVAEECVGDRFANSHETALFDMRAKYADVVRTSDVIAYLNSTPELIS